MNISHHCHALIQKYMIDSVSHHYLTLSFINITFFYKFNYYSVCVCACVRSCVCLPLIKRARPQELRD